jgi:hypothetical protein
MASVSNSHGSNCCVVFLGGIAVVSRHLDPSNLSEERASRFMIPVPEALNPDLTHRS